MRGFIACLPLLVQFEAASIKPAQPSDNGYILRLPGGRLSAKNVTLKFLLRFAYGFTADQIAGGPKWIDADAFDIEATPEHDAGNEQVSRDRQIQLMLRSLLAERFQLRTHTETRELSAYVLTAARSGSRMETTAHPPGPQAHESTNGSLHSLTFQGAPVSFIARNLSSQLHRVVVDETGLAGAFDCRLEWSPDIEKADGDTGPSIFTAIQQQLGLTLRMRKTPVEVLVVDGAEKPSEN